MDNGDSTGPRSGRSGFAYAGGAVLLVVVYQFLFRRGLFDASLLNSAVRGPMIATCVMLFARGDARRLSASW
jgi:hypothetical protein